MTRRLRMEIKDYATTNGNKIVLHFKDYREEALFKTVDESVAEWLKELVDGENKDNNKGKKVHVFLRADEEGFVGHAMTSNEYIRSKVLAVISVILGLILIPFLVAAVFVLALVVLLILGVLVLWAKIKNIGKKKTTTEEIDFDDVNMEDLADCATCEEDCPLSGLNIP